MVPPLGVPDVHGAFVALGVAVAALVFFVEARRRGVRDERLYFLVLGALVGGAVLMRLGTWLQHADLQSNASLAEQWAYGNRSILGGLVGAWLGVHVAKRLCGYRQRSGDLFAPAVAAGMAVGRVGCLLTESQGSALIAASFVAEIAFHAAAFAAIWLWLRHRRTPSGELFVWYVAGYAAIRFVVEFARGNEVAVHLLGVGLTRPQLFLAATGPLVAARIVWQWRRGRYAGALRPVAPEPATVSR